MFSLAPSVGSVWAFSAQGIVPLSASANEHVFSSWVSARASSAFALAVYSYRCLGNECNDQVFAQVATAIAGSLMDTPENAIAIMQRLTRQGQTSYNVADAYKLDSIADWRSWVERATFELKGHAAKGAPNYMRLCRREDIGLRLSDHGHEGQCLFAIVSNKLALLQGIGSNMQQARSTQCQRRRTDRTAALPCELPGLRAQVAQRCCHDREVLVGRRNASTSVGTSSCRRLAAKPCSVA